MQPVAPNNVGESVNELLDGLDLTPEARSELMARLLTHALTREASASTEADRRRLETLSQKLEVLYEYEKKHLDLLKEYKEELKFARTLQEDIRRERSHFFAQTLKEVSSTLQQAQVDNTVAAEWIQELVRSYTASLDVSDELVRTAAIERLGNLRELSVATSSTVERSVAPHEADAGNGEA